jgi:putative aldouronate transport system substrate-binding protein
MKKKANQAVSVLLVFMMAIVFSGCTKSATTTDSSPASTAAATTSETAKQAKVVNLEVFAMTSTRVGELKGWWPDILKEKVGVNLNLLPAGDQGDQKLQALMAGGELPDIVVFHSRKQVEDAIKADMLINLDDHLDKLPNVVKYASTALQYYRDTASNGTGKAYAATTYVGPVEESKDLNWGPYMRWDLYKKLGMPEITKIEDYLPLMKKMQELEPKNKDGQKVYGLTFWKDWDETTMQQATTLSNSFGIDTGDQLSAALPFMQLNLNNGATTSILAPDSEYIRTLKFYYQANQMGLVDPDSLTQQFETAREKFKQGRVLFSWWPWLGFDYNTGDRINATPPTGFQAVIGKNSKLFKFGDQKLGGDPWAFAIGKNTKNLDAALRYIDFMYSIEANSLLSNGPKGFIWDINDKGEPYVTEQGWDVLTNNKDMPGGGKMTDGSNQVGVKGLTGTVINPDTKMPVSLHFWPSTLAHTPSKLEKDWEDTTGFKNPVEMVKSKNMFVTQPIAMKLVPTLSEEMTTLKTRIGDVVKNDSWLAIFAKDDADFQKKIDGMVKKAEGLGIQKLIDYDLVIWKQAQEEAKKYEK